jgi:hypothetical protein
MTQPQNAPKPPIDAMTPLRIFTTLALAAAACSLHAAPRDQACTDDDLTSVAQAFKIANFKISDTDDSSVAASACQLWPFDNKSYIVAMAVNEGKEWQKTLLVAIIDSGTGRMGARYRGVIEEDAITVLRGGNLRIDTARYDLAPGRRAFGVDVSSSISGPRCAEGGIGPSRTLFLPDKKQLLPVVENLTLSQWTYVQGADTACAGTDAKRPEDEPVVETTTLSLSVAGSVTNGLHDLLATATSTVDDDKKPARKPYKTLMKFDGRRYDTAGVMGF